MIRPLETPASAGQPLPAETHLPWLRRVARRAVTAALMLAMLLATPSAALAQKKKKQEEAAPQKSYVMPYMIVMMMISVGLMTVCRPGKRKERPDEIKDEAA